MDKYNNRIIRQVEGITRLGKSQLNYIIANIERFDISAGLFLAPGNIVKDIRAVKTLLVRYHQALDDEGSTTVGYQQIDGTGRYYHRAQCGMALQSMTRKVRHTICQHNQIDFDMKNAHPVLLAWYCRTHKIPCDSLQYYCDYRDECIKSLKRFPVGDDYSAPKQLVCSIINGGDKDYKHYYETWGFLDKDLPEWFTCFYKQLRRVIIPAIIGKHPEQFETIKKRCQSKEFYNPYGSLMSYVMSKMENECLMAAKDWVESVGLKPVCLAYDGLHLYTEGANSMSVYAIETGMSAAVKKATGRTVVWSKKPFREAFDMASKGWTPEYKPVDLRLVDGVFPHTDLIKPFAIVATDSVRVVEIPEAVKWVSEKRVGNGVKVYSKHSDSYTPPSIERMFGRDKVVCIRAAMGTGKTFAICQYIRRNGFPRVLVLSPRISYASSIVNDYNNVAVCQGGSLFKSYTVFKNKHKLGLCPRLVCSMESLHYLDIAEIERRPFDLLVCDESHANLIAHVCSTTNGGNFEENQGVMKTLMNTTPKIIFADAFLGSKTLDYIQLMGHKTTLYDYKAKMVARTAVNVPSWYLDGTGEIKGDKNALLPFLIDSLKKGERNYVFVSSAVRLRDWVEILKQEFTDKKIKSYTSGQGKSIKNVNEEWGGCDCVLTTSTITVGINFDRIWFHNVFVCASTSCDNLVSDIFQSHYRVRHLINNKMYFSLSAITLDDAHCSSLCAYDKVMARDVDGKEAYSLRWNPDCARASVSMKALVASVEQEVKLSKLRLELMFKYYLMLCNYTEEILPVEMRIPFSCGAHIDVPRFDDLVLISPGRENDLRQIQMSTNQCLTTAEKWLLKKYHFVKFTSDSSLTVMEHTATAKRAEGTAINDWLFESPKGARQALWTLYNELRGKFHSIRRHERIRRKIESTEAIRERSMQRNRFALFQEHRWEKATIVEGVLECLAIGHLNNLGVEVSYDEMRGFYQENVNSAMPWSRLFDQMRSGARRKRYGNCSFKHFVGLVSIILRSVGFSQLTRKRVTIKKEPPERNKNGDFKRVSDPTAPWILTQAVTQRTQKWLGFGDDLPENLGLELVSVFDFYDPSQRSKKKRLIHWSCSTDECCVEVPWELNPSGLMCEVCKTLDRDRPHGDTVAVAVSMDYILDILVNHN